MVEWGWEGGIDLFGVFFKMNVNGKGNIEIDIYIFTYMNQHLKFK